MTSDHQAFPGLKEVVDAVSGPILMANTAGVARWVRLSGTPEEREAVDYLRGLLDAYGYKTQVIEHDALISLPGAASAAVEGAPGKGSEDLGPCQTHCFAVATPKGGVAGELVDLGEGSTADYAGANVRGKIVLLNGLAAGDRNVRAEDAGAIAQIYIQDDYIRMMPVSPLWGAPTPETKQLIPTTPSVSLTQTAGKRLRALLAQGPVRVRLQAEVDTGWRKIPQLVGEIAAPSDGGQYVLLTNHQDSWYFGAMDNGSANATALEVARLMARNAAQLRRGLRVIFWSGHSHGRFAGSSWYVDNYFEDLYDHCIAHVNVDSTGGMNATVIDEAPVMAETKALAADCIGYVTGQGFTGKRIGRFGDQSFVGVGLSSIFATFSEQDINDTGPNALRFAGAHGARSGGLGWWWHNENDTVDKVDEAFLVRDTKIYVAAMWRLLTQPVLPFDFAATAREFVDVLSDYQNQAKGRLDLSRPIALAKTLEERVASLAAAAGAGDSAKTTAAVNKCLLSLSRTLVPIGYTIRGPFGQDMAGSLPALPGLKDVGRLGQLPEGDEDILVWKTALVREVTRVTFGLRRAIELVDGTLLHLRMR